MTDDAESRRARLVAQGRAAGVTWDDLAEQIGGISGKGLCAWWAYRTRMLRAARAAEERAHRYVNRPRTTERACLRCQKTFDSEGPHNRLCGSCRNAT
jgi:hypothetical protein